MKDKNTTHIKTTVESKEWLKNCSKMLGVKEYKFLDELRRSDKINRMMMEEKTKRDMELRRKLGMR